MPIVSIQHKKPRSYPKPLYVQEIAADGGPDWQHVTGAYVNGELKGLDYLVEKDAEIVFVY